MLPHLNILDGGRAFFIWFHGDFIDELVRTMWLDVLEIHFNVVFVLWCVLVLRWMDDIFGYFVFASWNVVYVVDQQVLPPSFGQGFFWKTLLPKSSFVGTTFSLMLCPLNFVICQCGSPQDGRNLLQLRKSSQVTWGSFSWWRR